MDSQGNGYMKKTKSGQADGNRTRQVYILKAWFWYTTKYIKARLGKAKSGVDKDMYQV